MIEPWGREGFDWSSPTADDFEIEALQTDVMRFMAILGFILSVIFALVQSLPFLPRDVNPSLENHDALQADIEILKNHIDSQLVVLETLETEVNRLQIFKAKTERELEKLTDKRSQIAQEFQKIFNRLKASRVQVATLEKDFLDKKKSLRIVRRRIEQERQELQMVQKQLVQLRKEFLEFKIQIKPVQRDQAISIIQQSLKPAQKQIESKRQQNLQPSTPPITEPAPPPKRAGFSLKFKSDRALDRLVANQFIRFYVFLGDVSWRIYLTRGKPDFRLARKPDQFHEMDHITVPGHYLAGFKRVVSAPGQNREIWGVKLPIALSRRIKTLIRDNHGGDIIIDGDGHIEVENPNL